MSKETEEEIERSRGWGLRATRWREAEESRLKQEGEEKTLLKEMSRRERREDERKDTDFNNSVERERKNLCPQLKFNYKKFRWRREFELTHDVSFNVSVSQRGNVRSGQSADPHGHRPLPAALFKSNMSKNSTLENHHELSQSPTAQSQGQRLELSNAQRIRIGNRKRHWFLLQDWPHIQ